MRGIRAIELVDRHVEPLFSSGQGDGCYQLVCIATA